MQSIDKVVLIIIKRIVVQAMKRDGSEDENS